MKRIALSVAAFAVLGIASSQALAAHRTSYPMAAHVAARNANGHGGHQAIAHQVHYRHGGQHGDQGYRGGHYGYQGYSGHHGHHRYHGRPPVYVYPPVYVPTYYGSPYGFGYRGPGFSIGVGW